MFSLKLKTDDLTEECGLAFGAAAAAAVVAKQRWMAGPCCRHVVTVVCRHALSPSERLGCVAGMWPPVPCMGRRHRRDTDIDLSSPSFRQMSLAVL